MSYKDLRRYAKSLEDIEEYIKKIEEVEGGGLDYAFVLEVIRKNLQDVVTCSKCANGVRRDEDCYVCRYTGETHEYSWYCQRSRRGANADDDENEDNPSINTTSNSVTVECSGSNAGAYVDTERLNAMLNTYRRSTESLHTVHDIPFEYTPPAEAVETFIPRPVTIQYEDPLVTEAVDGSPDSNFIIHS